MAELKIPPYGTGRTPTEEESEKILRAVEYGETDTLLHLSSGGVDITAARNDRDDSPLHNAALGGEVDIVKVLLAAGMPVGIKNKTGWTPLHKASATGKEKVVQLLVNSNAMVDAMDNDGHTPLNCAVFHGDANTVKYLVNEANADCSKVIRNWQQKLNKLLTKKEDSTESSHDSQQGPSN